VQVLRSGTWTTLEPITAGDQPDVYGFDITGKDTTITADSGADAKVRVTYRKDTPAGKTTVHPCAFVDGGPTPFSGTTFCGASASITVKAAGSGTTNPTASATPSPSTSATPSATSTATTTPTATTTSSGTASGTTSGTTTQLAKTGSRSVSATTVTATTLIAAGTGTLGFIALRRRRNGA